MLCKRSQSSLAILGLLLLTSVAAHAQPSPADYQQVAAEVGANLDRQVLSKWFPASIDNLRGGFHQNYAENWDRLPLEDRAIVYQSRLTWISSAAASSKRSAKTSKELIAASLHGEQFLAEKLWDAQDGGFFWSLSDDGKPERDGEKHTYGISFGIYASAECYRVTHSKQALNLALKAYQWLDQHAHDGVNGGYYEALTRAGKPILVSINKGIGNDFIGTKYGLKSMNTHIHLLEAFTALYQVHPTTEMRSRLKELFEIVRDRVVTPIGYQYLYFQPNWQPVPDHDSYGHDVETAYLLAEAAEELEMGADTRTRKIERSILDHALQYGWDEAHGGFYDAGEPNGKVTATDKIWWTQAEGLNALLLMHSQYGTETSKYWDAFVKEWQFIQKHQIDPTNGGWYAAVEADGTPFKNRVKSDRWTEAYHQGRALLNVSHMLHKLAE